MQADFLKCWVILSIHRGANRPRRGRGHTATSVATSRSHLCLLTGWYIPCHLLGIQSLVGRGSEALPFPLSLNIADMHDTIFIFSIVWVHFFKMDCKLYEAPGANLFMDLIQSCLVGFIYLHPHLLAIAHSLGHLCVCPMFIFVCVYVMTVSWLIYGELSGGP